MDMSEGALRPPVKLDLNDLVGQITNKKNPKPTNQPTNNMVQQISNFCERTNYKLLFCFLKDQKESFI